jgi:hypothetical protein
MAPDVSARGDPLRSAASDPPLARFLALVQTSGRPALTGKERATAGAAAPKRRYRPFP